MQIICIGHRTFNTCHLELLDCISALHMVGMYPLDPIRSP
jgi:hypothetical protein